jgi:hypothetical protein
MQEMMLYKAIPAMTKYLQVMATIFLQGPDNITLIVMQE